MFCRSCLLVLDGSDSRRTQDARLCFGDFFSKRGSLWLQRRRYNLPFRSTKDGGYDVIMCFVLKIGAIRASNIQ